VSKLKLKNKTSSNEEFISEVHWNFYNIYVLISKSFKLHDYCKFVSLKVHFTLKHLIFFMSFFLSITCLGIFIGWIINIYD
jgi:hypothetical protein